MHGVYLDTQYFLPLEDIWRNRERITRGIRNDVNRAAHNLDLLVVSSVTYNDERSYLL